MSLSWCFRVLNCDEDQEDLAAHAFAVFLEDLSVFHQLMSYYTSIIAIPRGGAGCRQPNDYSRLANLLLWAGQIIKAC